MTEDLRISMIQSHIIWEDREENLGYYGELLRRVSGRTDLAVLPGDVYYGIFHGRRETSRYDGWTDCTDYKGMG